MNIKSPQNYSFDSVSILGIIIKYRKPILILTIIALIVSVIVSFIIKPKFKSTVILFPATTNSISQALLTDQLSGQPKDLLEFGEEEESEQLLQILHSDIIRSKVIEKYNLMAHYNIDPESSYPLTKLNKKFEDNISFQRTKFMAVEIEVLDTDPKVAADIANTISELLNETKTAIQRDRALKGLKISEDAYLSKVNQINEIKDSLKSINMKGVFDFDEQSLALNDAYAKALVSGNQNGIKSIEKQLNNLAMYGSEFLKYSQSLEYEVESLTKMREKYERAKVDAEKEIPHIFIVNRAFPAEKKSYPIRWLIVTLSVLGTFLLSLLIAVGLENYVIIK